jgi:hypothetical protein
MREARRTMDERGSIAAAARPLVRAIHEAMGDDWSAGEDLEVVRTRDGSIMVRSEDLWFFFDPDTGALSAGQRGEDGSAAFGAVAPGGSIRWSSTIVDQSAMA